MIPAALAPVPVHVLDVASAGSQGQANAGSVAAGDIHPKPANSLLGRQAYVMTLANAGRSVPYAEGIVLIFNGGV